MPRFDASDSVCRVYTHRAGVLGAVGHDLEIHAEDFWIAVDEERSNVTAEINAASLRPVDSVKGRELQRGKLSDKDKRDIAANIESDVLEANRYPTIRFDSTSVEPVSDGYRVRGRLKLHGHERDIEFVARPKSGRMVAEVTLHQPDFGITPYRAFGGALKVKPEVVVEVSTPALA